MSTEIRSACADNLQKADEFKPATELDAERLQPCGICFPDGEIDVKPADTGLSGIGEF